MADLQERIIIDKPIDQVFAFFANPENRTKYITNVVKHEKLTNESGIGARFKEVRQLSNRKVASELEISTYEVNKKLVFTTDSNGLKVNYIYIFEEVDEGTKVWFEGKVETNSFRTRIMRPFLVKMVKQEDGDTLLSAKKELEPDKIGEESNN